MCGIAGFVDASQGTSAERLTQIAEHMAAQLVHRGPDDAGALADAGYEFSTPGGAFYLFPKSPLPDDVAFTDVLKEERILVVPGSGFGGPAQGSCLPWIWRQPHPHDASKTAR